MPLASEHANSYVFEQIYDVSSFHAEIYLGAALTTALGLAFLAMSVTPAVMIGLSQQARARFREAELRAKVSLIPIAILGLALVIGGGCNLAAVVHRKRQFVADLQSPQCMTTDGVISDYASSYGAGRGNAAPNNFRIGHLRFSYNRFAETFHDSGKDWGPIFNGRHVRVTYIPSSPGQPITEILRVAVGYPTS